MSQAEDRLQVLREAGVFEGVVPCTEDDLRDMIRLVNVDVTVSPDGQINVLFDMPKKVEDVFRLFTLKTGRNLLDEIIDHSMAEVMEKHGVRLRRTDVSDLPDLEGGMTTPQRIKATLRDGEASLEYLRESMADVKTGTIDAALSRLVANSQVIRLQSGHYGLAHRE